MTARKEKAPVTPTTGWWSTTPAGWPEATDATYARWHKNQRGKATFDEAAAKGAMEFGFGSREQYGEHRQWNDLVDQLQADWQEAGRESEHAWADVANVVKAGWTAAGIHPEPAHDARTPTDGQEPASHLLPGERPHLHS